MVMGIGCFNLRNMNLYTNHCEIMVLSEAGRAPRVLTLTENTETKTKKPKTFCFFFSSFSSETLQNTQKKYHLGVFIYQSKINTLSTVQIRLDDCRLVDHRVNQ